MRSFITEGGRATISAFRLGDLSEPLTLPLTWSGDAVERFTNLPDEITIPENHSTRDINIQSRNDDTHQGSGELTIQIDVSATPELNISGQGVNDTLVIADNDHKPEPEIYTVAGEITVEGAHEFVVTATPMSDEGELDESELDGRAEEYRSPISGVYSLALPEGGGAPGAGAAPLGAATAAAGNKVPSAPGDAGEAVAAEGRKEPEATAGAV